jgi:putative tricarboxylic transport membrane protein
MMPRAIAALILCFALSAGAIAQDAWRPTRTVELIVPTSPGGGTDETARVIHAILNRPGTLDMVVLNRGGAGGGIAYAYMNRFEGSGQHLSLSTLNLVTNSMTGQHALRYTEVTPIAHLFSEYPVFVVRTDSSIKDGRDLVSRLKANPASHNFAFSPGLGGALHLATGVALKAAGIDPSKPTLVVYQSAGEATAAVLGGHVDVGVMNPPVAIAQSHAGKVRMIAVGSPKRLPGALAAVPTWKEQGVDAVSASWRGVIGPKGMSDAQIAFWEKALEEMTRTDAWKRHLEQNVRENEFMGSKATRQYYAKQAAQLKAVIESLGLAK